MTHFAILSLSLFDTKRNHDLSILQVKLHSQVNFDLA